MTPTDPQDRQTALATSSAWPDVEGLSVTVVGLGKSGVAAANALARRGARVLCIDDKPEHELSDALGRLLPDVQAHCGASGPLGRRGDLFVLSPGIMPHSRRFRDIQGMATAVLSEIELFYRLDRGHRHGLGHPIVAISGTDGKTTTTLWTAHLLRQAGRQVVVGGNIGDPLCDFLDTMGADDIVVAEVSAFQLYTCSAFRPRAAVVTNIAADHLDWFAGDMASYVRTKAKVGDAMGAGDTLFLNGDDPELATERARLQAGVPHAWANFTVRGLPHCGFGFDGTTLQWCLAPGAQVPLVDQSELGSLGAHPIEGIHNVENALGASALALSLATPLTAVRAGLRSFSLPSHRLEPVGSIGRVRFVDDSKATNPHAAIAGLQAIRIGEGERLVWIGGGSEKDADFAELAEVVGGRAASVILLGQTAERIAAVLPRGLDTHRVARLEDAVPLGLQLAGDAGVVLLSPACASFDMFRGYAHRGEVFATAVKRLQQAIGTAAV